MKQVLASLLFTSSTASVEALHGSTSKSSSIRAHNRKGPLSMVQTRTQSGAQSQSMSTTSTSSGMMMSTRTRNIFGPSNGNHEFLHPVGFSQKLRICNAYADDEKVDIFKSTGERLTKDEEGGALGYKDCRDFDTHLEAGDKLKFKLSNYDLGAFQISQLPEHDATMFLALYRHDTKSNAVSFASHTFSSLVNAQLAVLDLYRGPKSLSSGGSDSNQNVQLDIADFGNSDKPALGRREQVNFDTVVAVNPGRFEAQLYGNSNLKSSTGNLKEDLKKLDASESSNTMANNVAFNNKANLSTTTINSATGIPLTLSKKQEFTAQDRENYVILRIGTEGEGVPKRFGEDLLVFPQVSGAGYVEKVENSGFFQGLWKDLKRIVFFTE